MFSACRLLVPLLFTIAMANVHACEEHAGGGMDPKVSAVLAATAREQPPSATAAVGAPVAPVITRALPAEPARAEMTPADDLQAMRLFEEPLVPFGPSPDSETRDLLILAERFRAEPSLGTIEALAQWASSHPASAWSTSLEVGLGLWYRRQGYVSRALPLWESAWKRSQGAKALDERALADRSVGELVQVYAWIGRTETLDGLFDQIGDRQVVGPGRERVEQARMGRLSMRSHPGISFQCGPLAITRILARAKASASAIERVRGYPSTEQGTNLLQLRNLAREAGLPARVACRAPGAPLVVPSVLHWKLEHFGALVEDADGRAMVEDSTFDSFQGQMLSIRHAALDDQSSGYFLTFVEKLPPGWSEVADADAAKIWGRGAPGTFDTDAYGAGEPGTCGGNSSGMPVASIQFAQVNLRLEDTPLAYAPPVGPAVRFSVVYNQRENQQPAVFATSNLGSRWTHSYESYVIDDPTFAMGTMAVSVYMPGGGIERHTWTTPPGTGGVYRYPAFYPANSHAYKSGAAFEREIGGGMYRRILPDGTRLTYAKSDGAVSNPRKIYLTKIEDPYANALTLGYDTNLRLTSITDAIGQVSILSYANSDPKKITKVTDPFGRHADFTYNVNGRLSGISDTLGLSSTIAYIGTGDVAESMTTPYGTTAFTYEATGHGQRSVKITDPLGGVEKVEYNNDIPGPVIDGGLFPSGDPAWTGAQTQGGWYSVYHWDKKIYHHHPDDRSKAVYYKLLTGAGGGLSISSLISLIKKPNERAVWFAYPGQGANSQSAPVTLAKPRAIGRVLPDGSTQLTKVSYTNAGSPTRITDPLGRITECEYLADGVSLTVIKQATGPGALDPRVVLTSLTYYPIDSYAAMEWVRRPVQTIRDAAGGLTQFAYNTRIQLSSIVNAKIEQTQFLYTASGYLDRIRDASNTDTIFGYDGYGRLRTVTDRDGDVTTTDYDIFDRPTQTTFADGTMERIAYDRLDAEWFADRAGRWTRIFTDSLRRTVAVRDPQGRVTALEWCLCGSIGRLGDGNGRPTKWEYDLSGHLLAKIFNDGRRTSYAYDAVGRPSVVTDAKGQTATYTYAADDKVLSVAYANAAVTTPGVTYGYDPIYGRLSSMVDDLGTTAYDYYPLSPDPVASPLLGAGRTKSIDGPWANDVVTFSYDKLGRTAGQTINGTASTVAYDNLGRVGSMLNALGTFTYEYQGMTGRLGSVLYPNNQQASFTYHGKTGGRRLQTIANRKTPDGVNLSTFSYGYDTLGRITAWTRQNDAAASTTYTLGYDRADQLVSAVLANAGGGVLTSYGYTYDQGGNRTIRHVSSASPVQEIVNNLNQLTGESAAGEIRIDGATDEPATVTVNGQLTQAGAGNAFTGKATVAPGTSTVTVQATDGSGNARTKQYSFTNAAGAGRSISYDFNGNALADGIRIYTWDAKDQLVAIEWTSVVGTLQRTEISYNGLGQRVRMVEKTNGAVTSNITYLWAGSSIAEERDSSGGTVTKRYLSGGLMVGATKYFFTGDHLGSVREVTDNSGNVVARFDYDPYGNRTQVSGTFDPGMGFTGHFHHASGLVLTWFRGYDPVTARWLSRDPIGEAGGVNLYAYVENNPTSFSDPLGLVGNTRPGSSISRSALDDAMDAARGYKLDEVQNADGSCGVDRGPDPLDVLGDYLTNKAADYAIAVAVTVVTGGVGVAAYKLYRHIKPLNPARLIPVTRWPGGAGLQPGNWVMTGGKTRLNHLLSGKGQPASWPGGNIPAPFSSGTTFNVPAGSLSTPSGWSIDGWVKGALGQRQYNGSAIP